jgi:hypothetical protein
MKKERSEEEEMFNKADIGWMWLASSLYQLCWSILVTTGHVWHSPGLRKLTFPIGTIGPIEQRQSKRKSNTIPIDTNRINRNYRVSYSH